MDDGTSAHSIQAYYRHKMTAIRLSHSMCNATLPIHFSLPLHQTPIHQRLLCLAWATSHPSQCKRCCIQRWTCRFGRGRANKHHDTILCLVCLSGEQVNKINESISDAILLSCDSPRNVSAQMLALRHIQSGIHSLIVLRESYPHHSSQLTAHSNTFANHQHYR